MNEPCSVNDCNRGSRAKGFCSLHYSRYRKYGDPHITAFVRKVSNVKKCEVEDCSIQSSIAQYCEYHYARFKKTGSPTTPKKKNLLPKGTPCMVEDCKGKVVSFGYCAVHYGRLKKFGDVNTFKKVAKYNQNDICKVDGCNSRMKAKELCNKHYLMWKKHGDPKGGKYEMKVRKAIDHDDGTRTCSDCEQRLPLSEFHKDKTATGGRRSKCKSCRINLVKDWYQDNKERQSGREKKRRRANVEKYAEKEALRYIKDRDKRIGLATEHSHRRKARKLKTVIEKGISKNALKKKFGTKCFYCEKEMDFSVGVGRKFNKDMATIEHLIPLARGGEHTWENTVLACRHCNISKNAKTIAEFEDFNRED
jgi:5-methylcytosine-specific restriction endonuclease McrA